MSEKDFDVQCTAQVGCTHKKKEDPSGKESSFEFSIIFGISPKVLNIIENLVKVIALIKSIIAYRR